MELYFLSFTYFILLSGRYAFQTIFGTKNFMERFNIDPSGAIMVRLAGAFMMAVFLMSVYVGFVRPSGLNGHGLLKFGLY